MSYVIDTNVLLRLEDEGDPRHEQCASAIDLLRDRGETLFICARVLAGFWVVMTRPRSSNGWGIEFEEVVAQMLDVRESFACLLEPPDIADRWQRLVIENKTMGKPAHDARLVALMLAQGVAHIITLNPDDFARYTQITPLTPQQILGFHRKP